MSAVRVLAWGARVSAAFRARVNEIAAALGFDPSWLMACIAFETGRTFSPAVRNAAGSGATGLVQFMPDTARLLGTSVEALARMSAEEQLEFVARYLAPYRGRLRSLSDVYMAILWPRGIGRAEADVIFPAGSREWLQNRGLDLDHDGAVTKGEATAFVARLLAEGLQPEHAVELAAPIEDLSTTADAATVAAARASTQGPTMPESKDGPSFGDFVSAAAPILTAIATALNPIAGVIVGALAPKVQQALAREIDRHKVTAGAGEAISQAVIGTALEVVGLAGRKDAAAQVQAANAVATDPEVARLVGERLMPKVEEIAPLLDRIVELDRARWQADVASADAAAVRARGDKVDIGPRMALRTDGLMLVALVGVVGAIALLIALGKPVDNTLWLLAGTLVYSVSRSYEKPRAYRWGEKNEGQAAAALTGELEARRPVRVEPRT